MYNAQNNIIPCFKFNNVKVMDSRVSKDVFACSLTLSINSKLSKGQAFIDSKFKTSLRTQVS
jgi:hypothetical protein